MKKCIYLTIAAGIITAAVITGCALLRERSAEIHQTISTALQKAYDNGGAEKVNAKIDSLVEEGKLSSLQAEKLKEALQKGYDSMQDKLQELSKETTAETTAE